MLLAALASACGSATKTATAAPADGMSWESILQLPDLSGWWIWDYKATNDFGAGGLQGPLPIKAEILERNKETNQQTVALFTRARASDASYEDGAKLTALLSQAYCLPPHFVGAQADEGAVEFLFTPGRVTILGESGLVRRVVLNQPLPAEIAESSAGTSVGHWEGQTLVVETTGFDSEWLLYGQKLGKNARSVERISLKEPGVLQIALTLTVPDLFSVPYDHTYIFRRDPEHQFTEASHCKPNDRSVDPVTHQDRLDLTPPPDLPPPPRD